MRVPDRVAVPYRSLRGSVAVPAIGAKLLDTFIRSFLPLVWPAAFRWRRVQRVQVRVATVGRFALCVRCPDVSRGLFPLDSLRQTHRQLRHIYRSARACGGIISLLAEAPLLEITAFPARQEQSLAACLPEWKRMSALDPHPLLLDMTDSILALFNLFQTSKLG